MQMSVEKNLDLGKSLTHAISEPFIKKEDLDIEYENVFEEYLEEINNRQNSINSKLKKKIQKSVVADKE